MGMRRTGLARGYKLLWSILAGTNSGDQTLDYYDGRVPTRVVLAITINRAPGSFHREFSGCREVFTTRSDRGPHYRKANQMSLSWLEVKQSSRLTGEFVTNNHALHGTVRDSTIAAIRGHSFSQDYKERVWTIIEEIRDRCPFVAVNSRNIAAE